MYSLYFYLRYLLQARHWKGYGIHSPFVFDLVRNLLYDSSSYYHFDRIREIRQKQLFDPTMIRIMDKGAGSKRLKGNFRKVKHIIRTSSIDPKFGEVLFKLVVHFKPATIVELGTSLGMSSLYLGLPDSSATVYTMDACNDCIRYAKSMFDSLGMNNVKVITGRFDEQLPELLKGIKQLDFVFIDGHHEEEATVSYFLQFLNHSHNDTVMVFDDIHWSKGMDNAWQSVCNHPQVSVTIDLFRLGIVFLRKECQKQHFVVWY